MSSPHAFDELGRILAAGGIRSAGWAHDKSLIGLAAVNWLMGRFPSLSRSQAGRLATLGRQYRQAGAGVAGGIGGPGLPLDGIPVVPELYGGANQGRRIQYEVRVNMDPGGGDPGGLRTIFVDSATVMTPDEIISQVVAQMGQDAGGRERYERLLAGISQGGMVSASIVGAVRAF